MFGILLASLATLIGEGGQSISKNEVNQRHQTPIEALVLNLVFGILVVGLFVLFVPQESLLKEVFGGFTFNLESLPWVTLRFLLEIVVYYVFTVGITKATRATFSFLRMLTIPFLLLTDIALGYVFTMWEILGVIIILLTTATLFSTRTLKRDGMWYVVIGALLAVATVSIYKYTITEYNSVAAEQLIVSTGLLVFFTIASIIETRRIPFRHFKRRKVVAQAFAVSMEGVITSFAFIFAPSTIVMTARRASAIFWAILSGRHFFHEQHFGAKLAGLGMLSIGLVMLVVVNL